MAEEQEFDSEYEVSGFSLSSHSDWVWDGMESGALSHRQVCDADHLPPSVLEIKKACTLYVFMAWWLDSRTTLHFTHFLRQMTLSESVMGIFSVRMFHFPDCLTYFFHGPY
jgi:hypothetical protein